MIAVLTGTSDNGESITVHIEECGLDRTITVNGVKMRSVYDPDTVIEDAFRIVNRIYGGVEWLTVIPS